MIEPERVAVFGMSLRGAVAQRGDQLCERLSNFIAIEASLDGKGPTAFKKVLVLG